MKKAYLDANFLVCLFIPNNQYQAPAMQLFAQLRTNKYKLYISPLALDELWWAVYEEKKKVGQIQQGIQEVFQEIKQSWEAIKNFSNAIKILQIKRPIKEGVEKALDFIDNYNLKPRDAFHLATADSQDIKEFVTNDSDFTNKDWSSEGFTIRAF